VTLYAPRHFASDDTATARALVDAHPFATLVTAVDGAEPHVSHLPMLLADGALWGHLARANPHVSQFARGRSVAIFHGPHAYVSPRWYEQPGASVPTWNYATVHVSATPELLDDVAAQRVLHELTARFEAGAWSAAPSHVESLVRGIVAFRIPFERWTLKLKMSQNRTAGDRQGVVAGLAATGAPDEAAVATWMQSHERT
jgi:transcriptional regulator